MEAKTLKVLESTLSTFRFVLNDHNTDLDPEARIIIRAQVVAVDGFIDAEFYSTGTRRQLKGDI